MKKKSNSTTTLPTRPNRRPKQAAIVTTQIASRPKQIPSEVLTNLETACKAGRWLVAVFRVEQEQLFLDRTANNFPKRDIDLAMRLIVEDVQKLKE